VNNTAQRGQVVELYDRSTKSCQHEQVFQQSFMDFFYGQSRLGRLLCELIIKRAWFSRLYGYWHARPASKNKIGPFIEQYQIDVDEIERAPEDYQSFDDFFCRSLKPNARLINHSPRALISIADARLLAFKIKQDTVYPIKGLAFSLPDLLPGFSAVDEFLDGDCLIFRLAPCDYHRFVYLDAGVQQLVHKIDGYLHSVNPLSLRRNLPVFTGNFREYCVIDTNSFGQVLHLDIGALTVGRIQQHQPQGGPCLKGQEKGFFRIGGSTVMLLFKPNQIVLDQDIAEQSALGIETIVKLGEKIGRKY